MYRPSSSLQLVFVRVALQLFFDIEMVMQIALSSCVNSEIDIRSDTNLSPRICERCCAEWTLCRIVICVARVHLFRCLMRFYLGLLSEF